VDEPNQRTKLKPIRHQQLDFFIAEILDSVSLKSDRHSMEFPMFSLSKQKDSNERTYRYELDNGDFVEVRISPGSKGIATQDDKDFLIIAISQYMAFRNKGLDVAKKIRVRPKELLVATNRYTGGRDYNLMADALERMEGTRIRTNISTGGIRQREGFGIIDGWKIIQRSSDGKADYIEITLSDWMIRALEGKEVLTLNPDYFRLPSGLIKRIYELVRKHCGYQPMWEIGMDKLHFKSGSQASLKRFRQTVRELFPGRKGEGSLDLLEYTMSLDPSRDIITFYRKPEFLLKSLTGEQPFLLEEVAEE